MWFSPPWPGGGGGTNLYTRALYGGAGYPIFDLLGLRWGFYSEQQQGLVLFSEPTR